MSNIVVQYYETPYGELIVGSFDEELCLCDWRYRKKRIAIDRRLEKYLDARYASGDSEVVRNTIQQLHEYFSRQRNTFDLPLLLLGTAFQKRVWNELLRVTFGKTASYLQLAKNIGNKTAVRAVASANGANAISIIVPCHRIIGSDGALTGYAGGMLAKEKLLKLEQDLIL